MGDFIKKGRTELSSQNGGLPFKMELEHTNESRMLPEKNTVFLKNSSFIYYRTVKFNILSKLPAWNAFIRGF